MKLNLLIFFGLCLIASIKTHAQYNRHSIVVSRETRKPIPLVHVRITQNGTTLASSETNQDGIFQYPPLANGKYRVCLEKKAYQADSVWIIADSYMPDTIQLSSAMQFKKRYENRLILLDNLRKNIDLKFGGSSCHKDQIVQLNQLKSKIEEFQRSIEKQEKEWKEHEQFMTDIDNRINKIENNVKKSLGSSSYKQKVDDAEAKWISNSQIQICIRKQLDTGCYPLNSKWILRTYLKAIDNNQPRYFADSITGKTEVSFSVQRTNQDTTYIFRPVYGKKQNTDNFEDFTVYLLGNSSVDTLKILKVQNKSNRNTQNKQLHSSTERKSHSKKLYKTDENPILDKRETLGMYVQLIRTQNWTSKNMPEVYEIKNIVYNERKTENYKPTIKILIGDSLSRPISLESEIPPTRNFKLPQSSEQVTNYLFSFKTDSLDVIQKFEITIWDKEKKEKISQEIWRKNTVRKINSPPDSTVGGFLLKVKSKHKK